MTPPKLFEHACTLYDLMQKQAEGDTFEGSKVTLFRKTGISQGYYTKIFDILTETGSIEQIRRGDSSVPTLIKLNKRPTLDDFNTAYRSSLTKPTAVDTLRQRVDALEQKGGEINLNSYIVNFDKRLTGLEARVRLLEGGISDATQQEQESTGE